MTNEKREIVMRALRTLFICGLLLVPVALQAQDPGDEPIDSVTVLSQPGRNAYECCHTLIITNRQPDSVPIREVRVVLLGEEGTFLVGQQGAPTDWNVFFDTRRIDWIVATNDGQIDSGESLTSFRFCVRDTGVYNVRWETHGPDGLLSFDTLTFACGSRDNCDDIFFRPVPSSRRCGLDIDLLVENGGQRIVNGFHVDLVEAGMNFDTAGLRIPVGWRLDAVQDRTLSFRATDAGRSFGEFVEGFRLYVDAPSRSSFRMAWRTTNFADEICTDTQSVFCGTVLPDTLFSRDVGGPDSCCRDFLLINTHRARTPLDGFRFVANRPGVTIMPGASGPAGWTTRRSATGDTVLFVAPVGGLGIGDSALFTAVCFDNDRAAVDSASYQWETLFEDLIVTEGTSSFFCRRDLLFCDSVEVTVDSSLTAPTRCLSLRLRNMNSRQDTIRKFVVRIDNPGVARRIVSVEKPSDWSIQEMTDDSVVFHRGRLLPGLSKDGFEICLSIDSGALDPTTLSTTTYVTERDTICTTVQEVAALLDRTCDSLVITENDASISPLCCFDLVLYNRNAKGLPIDRLEIRLPRNDLFFDTATASTGSWNVSTAFFPSVSVDFVADELAPGDSVRFSFCVNATIEPERPINFDVTWRTFADGIEVCRDTEEVFCEGAPGRCDSIAKGVNGDQGCFADYVLTNLHTPEGPIDNIEIRMLSPEASFVEGTSVTFADVSVSPQTLLLRNGTLLANESDNFTLRFSTTPPEIKEAIVEICTFEGDLELCCITDTIVCVTNSVGSGRGSGSGLFSKAVMVPNPASDESSLSLDLRSPASVALTIFDMNGRIVLALETATLPAGQVAIPLELSSLPSGSYSFVVEGLDDRMEGRFIR